MKKIILALTAIILSLSIYSCKKETGNIGSAKTVEANPAKRTEALNFSEPEEIIVNDELATALGYSSLVLTSGDYQISFGENSFGTTSFVIDESKSIANPAKGTALPDGGVGVRIRIAKRHQKNRECDCCGGVGFRCGFVSLDHVVTVDEFNNMENDDRTFYSMMKVENGNLVVNFTSEINWENIEQ